MCFFDPGEIFFFIGQKEVQQQSRTLSALLFILRFNIDLNLSGYLRALFDGLLFSLKAFVLLNSSFALTKLGAKAYSVIV